MTLVFSSAAFLFAFFPVYAAVVTLVRNTRACNVLLVIMSLLFYAWGEPVYVLLMLFSIAVNFLLALPAEKYAGNDCMQRRVLPGIAIAFDLTLLALFKYAGFLTDTVNSVLGASLPVPDIPLPVGISFFTFQTMSYVIDVYRGKCAVQRNIGKFTLYVSYFPQLIAGPIVRYREIAGQLDARNVTLTKTADGVRRFITGLSKKMLLANALGSVVDGIYSLDGSDINIVLAWTGGIFYTLQIYFDFSGYSDMAIGLGKMAGFRLPENFHYPFTACSVKDFWRRWHISLTTWFKDYVYIPMGGSRKGALRTGCNIMLVFLLTGMWHGAMWTFVLWGVFHGFFRLMEAYVIRPDKWKKPLAWLYTAVIVVSGFVIFRAESLCQAVAMLHNMLAGFGFTPNGLITLQSTITWHHFAVFAVALIAATPVAKKAGNLLCDKPRAKKALTAGKYAVSLFLLALCMMSLAASSYNPFIYFRF